MQPAKVLIRRWLWVSGILDVTWTGQVNVSNRHQNLTTYKKSLASPMVSSSQNLHLEWQRSHSLRYGDLILWQIPSTKAWARHPQCSFSLRTQYRCSASHVSLCSVESVEDYGKSLPVAARSCQLHPVCGEEKQHLLREWGETSACTASLSMRNYFIAPTGMQTYPVPVTHHTSLPWGLQAVKRAMLSCLADSFHLQRILRGNT